MTYLQKILDFHRQKAQNDNRNFETLYMEASAPLLLGDSGTH